MTDIAPVAEGRRIKSLDVLRGLAILGILVVNAPFFAAPWQAATNPSLAPLAVAPETLWSWFAPHVFFEMKFITLFSILFGTSIYLVGGERQDLERGALLRRRLFWLLIFGLLHGALIWFGDILLVYAIAGLFVMLARSWKAMTLATVGGLLYLFVIGVNFLSGQALSMASPQQLAETKALMWAPGAESLAQTIAAFRGGAAASTGANFGVWMDFLPWELFAATPRTIGVMMIGLALFKWGFLSGNAKLWLYGAVAAAGAFALAVVGAQAWTNYQAGFAFKHMQSVGVMPNQALSLFITLFYASVLIVLVRQGWLRPLTDALAPVGRMAFTNYIAQSLIMTAIFYGGRGLGLYGSVERPMLLAIVAGVWIAQVIWSRLWLARFEMGPLEWVWRRLSYTGAVRIVRRPEEPASGGSE